MPKHRTVKLGVIVQKAAQRQAVAAGVAPDEIGTRAFREAWQRACGGSRDDWGIENVYEHGGWELWKAAIRHAKKRRRA